jgi:peroxidase
MAMLTTWTWTCNAKLLMMTLVFAAALSATVTTSRAQSPPLQYNFYGASCPQAEATVRNVTEGIIANDRTMGAAFMRLFFHDCFVRVCIASKKLY